MANRYVVMGAAMMAAAFSSSAFADQVDMRFRGLGAGQVIRTEVWVGSTRVMNTNLGVGALNHEFSMRGTSRMSQINGGMGQVLAGQTIGTFCTDIMESVDDRWQRYSLTDTNNAPSTLRGQNAMGGDKAGRLAQLYGYGLANNLINGNGGWANSATSATRNNDQAAAWQLLVWEIVFDNPDAANWASSGATRFGNLRQEVRNFFAMFRDASLSFSTTLAGFRGASREGSQDQLVIVPLPPAAYAGMGVLAALAGASYIRRRRLNAAI